jgi:signal transduction histidine kinase
MHSSPEDHRRGLAALTAGVAALGIIAAWQGFAWADTRSWVPDLLAGWTLTGLGLAAATLERSRGAAGLLFASGVAWFIGDFHASGPYPLGWLALHLSWVFIAPLVQLALAYPSGRPRSLVTIAVLGATWIATATPWVNWNDDITLATAIAALTLFRTVLALWGERGAVRDEIVGTGALLLLLAWALAVPQLRPSLQPIAFDAGLAIVGAWLFAGLRRSGSLAERAIELDESTGTLRDALAELLRDSSLQIGFPTSSGGFVDESGRSVPGTALGRTVTELATGATVVGIVVHDPRIVFGCEERKAVSVAVALAARRARLRQELVRQADEVSRSTLRLIRAEDDERLKLTSRLGGGTGRSLSDAAQLIGDARAAAKGETELTASLSRAYTQLERARAELAALAGGLGVPALVVGLPAAVANLVDGLPLDAEVRVADFDCASELAATIWFVCAEGVTNVLKHAAASRLLIEVADGASGVHVLVEDNGRGGANANGSGLGGLRDRVAALGGTLRVELAPAGGTRLAATLPREVVAG